MISKMALSFSRSPDMLSVAARGSYLLARDDAYVGSKATLGLCKVAYSIFSLRVNAVLPSCATRSNAQNSSQASPKNTLERERVIRSASIRFTPPCMQTSTRTHDYVNGAHVEQN